MKRRQFIKLVGGAAAVGWPLTARAQQSAMPLIGFIRDGSADTNKDFAAAFRKGLNEAGYVERQNVTIEYHWLEGRYDHLQELLADLIDRKVAVIAAPGSVPTLAAKAATTTVPIVFGIGEDPVHLGLVASLAKPGGNATGVNFFVTKVLAKRLRLLHDLLPQAARIAVLVNPGNAAVAEPTVRDVQNAAPAMGLQIQIVKATTIGEIDAAFAAFAQERPDALFVAPDALFISRRVQLAVLTARDRIPAIYSIRDPVVAGGLVSYGADLAEVLHQIGVYSGNILKGAKPADLPVLQSTKFQLVINLSTAKALGLTIPAGLLSIADEVIE